MTSQQVEIEGRQLSLSNLDKVLYPAVPFTKGEVIDYYVRIAPVLLPHFRGRPLTLKRYPDGVDKDFFYEKNCPSHRPDWVKTVDVATGRESNRIDYCLLEDLSTLTWVANLASLELHPSLGSVPHLECADSMVFDLDPGLPATVIECCQVALLLKEALDGLGLLSVVKTSGSKGLQLHVPLNSETKYTQTRAFANALARLLERDQPQLVTSNMRKDLRVGKVLIDWSQNHQRKTTIGVYSLRAREEPTVSTPITWDEVKTAAGPDAGGALSFRAGEVVERVGRVGDLFEPMVLLRQELPVL